jgi:hypothetical protein
MEKKEERIKSALERALERVEQVEIGEERVKELEYLPQGERLAGQYLREDNYDLMAALSTYDASVRKFVLKGVESSLLSTIRLPQNEQDRREIKKSLDGLSLLKKNRNKVAELWGTLERLFNQYEQARKQYYQRFREEFEGALRQAMQQQMGMVVRGNIKVEMHPEFQQNWRQACAKLDAQYDPALERIKQELSRLT